MSTPLFTYVFPAFILLSGLFYKGDHSSAIPPPARFDHDEWDFGQIREYGGNVAYAFRYINQTSAPLVIEALRISCGCITPKYSKAPVLPGRTDSIRVVFDPAGHSGNFSRKLFVKFSHSDTPVSLTIRGSVTAEKYSPDREYSFAAADGLRLSHEALNFGQMPQRASRTFAVGFLNESKHEIQLSFRTEPHVRWLRVDGGGRVKPGESGVAEVTCSIAGDTLFGRCHCRVVPYIAGRTAGSGISVTAVATDNFEDIKSEYAPRLVTDAAYFEFEAKHTSELLTHTFTLTNTGAAPLIVRRVESSPGVTTDTSGSFTILPGGQRGLRCRIMTARNGKSAGIVTLITNDPSNPVCRLRLLSVSDND